LLPRRLPENHTPTRAAKFFQAVLDSTPQSKVQRSILIAARKPATVPVEAMARAFGDGSLASAPDTVPFSLWRSARQLDNFVQGLIVTTCAGGDCCSDRGAVGWGKTIFLPIGRKKRKHSLGV
jgi:hypothetical protein